MLHWKSERSSLSLWLMQNNGPIKEGYAAREILFGWRVGWREKGSRLFMKKEAPNWTWTLGCRFYLHFCFSVCRTPISFNSAYKRMIHCGTTNLPKVLNSVILWLSVELKWHPWLQYYYWVIDTWQVPQGDNASLALGIRQLLSNLESVKSLTPAWVGIDLHICQLYSIRNIYLNLPLLTILFLTLFSLHNIKSVSILG